MRLFKFKHRPKGFTLVEVIVATLIFMVASGVMLNTTVNFYRGYKRQLARDLLYEETRVLMDRIVHEIRVNTVDFDEYYNRLPAAEGGEEAAGYGDVYRQYYHHFFYINPPALDASCDYGLNDPDRNDTNCTLLDLDEGFFSTEADDNVANDSQPRNPSPVRAALGQTDPNQQDELYLINGDGNQKTIVKRSTNTIEMLKLDLADQHDNSTLVSGSPSGAADGYYDSWTANIDFPGKAFISITPPSIDVTDFQLFITPIDDPRKAFSESDVQVQAHPSVTILLTTEITSDVAAGFGGGTPPSITLQTTASSRILDNVLIPFEV